MASNRRALCVGINKFKNSPSTALHGCVNDTRDMTSVLKGFLGLTSKDITTLTDARATKVNIMKNLQSMVAGAKAGKYGYLVFCLSSHGTQIPQLECQATVRKARILVPGTEKAKKTKPVKKKSLNCKYFFSREQAKKYVNPPTIWNLL